MKKAYLFRLIFWGIITIIIISLGVIGFLENNKRFDSTKNTLTNITKVFNGNETVQKYNKIGNNVKAKVKNRSIYITFQDDTYKFKLKEDYLEGKISKNNTTDEMITMLLTDSIYVVNGGATGTIFQLFTDQIIYSYKLNQGIEFISNGEYYIVKIKINEKLEF